MSHDHCCEHKNLKYCGVCKVVYCTNCKKEWVEKYHWTLAYPQTTWYGTACGSYKLGDTITKGLCSHT